MQGYRAKSTMMELGTLASGSVIFALNNLSTTRPVSVKRLLAEKGFSGTAANSGIEFGVCRATGTPGGGTGNIAAGANIPKVGAGGPNSFCSIYYGPAAITGLSPDAAGDFAQTFLIHQVGQVIPVELIREDLREKWADEFVLAPSTSLVVITRTISVAGSKIALSVEWAEPPV